jgi:MYXO-CTERM domain-containing protein
VCCDSPCDGTLEACNLPGRVGVCSSTAAQAPAASREALALALALLAGLGILGVSRLRSV